MIGRLRFAVDVLLGRAKAVPIRDGMVYLAVTVGGQSYGGCVVRPDPRTVEEFFRAAANYVIGLLPHEPALGFGPIEELTEERLVEIGVTQAHEVVVNSPQGELVARRIFGSGESVVMDPWQEQDWLVRPKTRRPDVARVR